MSDRRAMLLTWLGTTAWATWTPTPLAGDASGRRYDRLQSPDGSETVILMDAPPETEGTERFLSLAAYLRSRGFAAPGILAADRARGFVLLEDLGPTDMAAWLRTHPGEESKLYRAATDILLHMARGPAPPDLTPLDPATGAAMLAPLWEHFDPALDPAPIRLAMEAALARHCTGPLTLALRDYHAENLIWRPDRTGLDRCGLLDFQDAILAHPAYDLASLLRDARRDVAPDTAEQAIDQMVTGLSADPDAFRAAFAVLAVQRNLRILGIFARLAQRNGKRGYLSLLPRVRGHLARDLAHPACADLARSLPTLRTAEGAT